MVYGILGTLVYLKVQLLIQVRMKKILPCFISMITMLAMTESCSTPAKMYYRSDISKTYTGQLDDSVYNAVKQYLVNTTGQTLKDTILIKYDYNNETCWDNLDQKEDEHIMGFVTRHQQRIQYVRATRPHVSVFDFREPGKRLNKIKKFDQSIIIDSSKQLFKLLFKERCTCGSSIMIMPDKRFVFLRSDSHSEILAMTQEQVEEILNKK